jgi:hypothetical protein
MVGTSHAKYFKWPIMVPIYGYDRIPAQILASSWNQASRTWPGPRVLVSLSTRTVFGLASENIMNSEFEYSFRFMPLQLSYHSWHQLTARPDEFGHLIGQVPCITQSSCIRQVLLPTFS